MLHLKPDDVPPAVPGKEPVGVGRGQPEFPEVVVDGELNAFEGAGHINGAGLVEQLVDAGLAGWRIALSRSSFFTMQAILILS